MVNAGDNTLSMFSVDPTDPTKLTLAGKPANTLGQYPVAVAYSPKNSIACVINAGGNTNVACLSVSKLGLTPLPYTVRSLGVTQTNPPTLPANSPADVIFSQNESQLFISVRGDKTGPVAGFIDVYQAVSVGGIFALSFTPVKSTPSAAILPFSLTPAGDNVIFNTDPAFGAVVSKFNAAGAIIASSNYTIDGQKGTCWSQYSPRTSSFYVTDGGQPLVTEFAVNTATTTAKIIASHTLNGSSSQGRIDQAIGSSRIGDFFYALNPLGGSIDVAVLPGPGIVLQIQTFDLKTGVPALTTLVQGLAVYMI